MQKKNIFILFLFLLLFLSSCVKDGQKSGFFSDKEPEYGPKLNGLEHFKVSLDTYYYYHLLDNQKKDIYTKLLNGIETYTSEIRIPNIHIDEINEIYHYILYDNPQIFYTRSFVKQTYSRQKDCMVKPDYSFTRQISEQYIANIYSYLQDFERISWYSDLDKELFIHSYILSNFLYDESLGINSFSIIGPIFEKKAVCEGFAKLTKLCFDYLEMKCLVVPGEASNPLDNKKESHAWNIVYINSQPYHLDVTYNLTLTEWQHRYDYFNLPDNDILTNRNVRYTIPTCKDNTYNYFVLNGLMANSYMDFERKIEQELKNGNKQIYLKIYNERYEKSRVDRIIQSSMDKYINIFKTNVNLDTLINDEQMVFEMRYR